MCSEQSTYLVSIVNLAMYIVHLKWSLITHLVSKITGKYKSFTDEILQLLKMLNPCIYCWSKKAQIKVMSRKSHTLI